MNDVHIESTCPNCGRPRLKDATECLGCGIIYERFHPVTDKPDQNPVTEEKSQEAWEERIPCSDGRCTGIIGTNGRCTKCGRNKGDEGQNPNLIDCGGCGKLISKNAVSCPHCGEPRVSVTVNSVQEPSEGAAKTKIGCFGLVCMLFVFFWIYSQFNTTSESPKPATPKTQEEIRKERIGKHFSSWDGSHRGLTKRIKESMNDPDSYDHEKTVYWDKGDHLIIETTFRGKNAFGGTVKNKARAKVGLEGNIIEVLYQGP